MYERHISKFTPAHFAAWKGDVQSFEALINTYGYDLNVKDDNGNTFMHAALMDVNIWSRKNMVAYLLAFRSECSGEIIVDLNIKNNFGVYPLYLTRIGTEMRNDSDNYNANKELMKFLIKKGAYIDSVNELETMSSDNKINYSTLLAYQLLCLEYSGQANRKQFLDIVDLLLECGADLANRTCKRHLDFFVSSKLFLKHLRECKEESEFCDYVEDLMVDGKNIRTFKYTPASIAEIDASRLEFI